jgi:WD40 repeat protein/serine/threonine protein kinase
MEIRPGQQVGNYQLVKVLGKGGFAEVYLGEHIHLGTLAAIKLLTTRLSDEESNHFREEARTIARLRHPNIIRVLEFGVEHDLPYLVMDYAPQGTLRQRFVKGRQLDPLTILPYVQQVVGALQFAHDRKLIHRDVKPENMLVGENGEVLLSDFGIAVVAQSSRHQDMQEVVGTLAYMAPEQIQAHPRPASDQYSLGVVIYEWLTGARPFAGSMSEILAKQISTPPPPLRDKIPNVSPELELVVLTALEKDPKDRFASMRAFLKAFEQATVGLTTTPTYQVSTMGPAGGAAANNVISTPSAPANSAPSANWPSVPQAPEPSNWPSAPQASEPSNWPSAPQASAPQASEPSGSGYPPALSGPPAKPVDSDANFLDAPTVMGSFLPPSPPENAQPFVPSAPGWQGSQAGAVLPGWQSAPVQTGPTILSSGPVQTGPTILSSGPLQSGPTLFSSGPAAPPMGAPPMGTPPMGTPLVPPPSKPPAKGVSRRKVLVAGAAGIVGLAVVGGGVAWLITSQNTPAHNGQTTPGATSTPSGPALYVYRGHTGAVRDIAWSIDGKRIATSGSDHTVQMWDAFNGEHAFSSHSHTAPVRGLSFSPDKQYLATASDDKTVEIFTLATQTISFTYHGHTDAVLAVAWAPVGANIASGGLDQTVQIWSLESKDKPLFTFKLTSGTTDHITSFAWAPDAKRIAGSSADGTIRIWNLETKKVDVTYRGHTAGVNSVAWSPDGARVVSGSSDKRAIIWDAHTGKTYGKDHSHTGSVDAVAWSPNGKYIATASTDGTVQILDAANYALLRTYSGHKGTVYAVAWSPDSEDIASAGDDGTAQVWKALPNA